MYKHISLILVNQIIEYNKWKINISESDYRI